MTTTRRVGIRREMWLVLLLIAFVIFVSTTYVTTYLGARGRGRAKIWSIWRDLTADLPGGGSDAVKVGYLLIVAVFLASSFFGLWLTLSTEIPTETMDDDTAQRPSSV